ncbi:ABC transporter ATP-binding protein [Agrococcus sp. SGAir0287]|uniref:ABC transporter ATP-binding protein n=1 Tax=Agrococcus sp. SGAir0287 TaxID=2070347 RepID=UPI0020C820CF|nr:ABC transporter ATP-binding protein [Agrococcus sp. SGAir0287]
MTEAHLPAIRLRGLRREFGPVTAVDGVDLDIAEGEFFSMLGPSGSGKTTVLRLIAGFETPTAGAVELFGKDVSGDAPYDRPVNTVFQDYALFPHMSVLENVAYGLRVRGVGRAERTRRATEALDRMRLADYGARRPSQLSGGQRQRVALARAIVVEPRALLLDEPLGALDRGLREQMQVELKQLQRDLGITFVFVTHDQDEALTLSDRIAVFDAGRIQQVGPAAEVYERPATPFVATFVGTSNLFDDAQSRALLGHGGIHAIRPEKLQIHRGETGDGLPGTVAEVIYAGASVRCVVDTDAGMRLTVLEQSSSGHASVARGDRVRIAWAHDDVRDLVEPETAERRAADDATTDPETPTPATASA